LTDRLELFKEKSMGLLLSDYFDPYNQKHLAAFEKKYTIGVFPSDFIDELVEHEIAQDYLWDVVAVKKMAKAWMGEKSHQPL
jgi:hypothetical protein